MTYPTGWLGKEENTKKGNYSKENLQGNWEAELNIAFNKGETIVYIDYQISVHSLMVKNGVLTNPVGHHNTEDINSQFNGQLCYVSIQADQHRF